MDGEELAEPEGEEDARLRGNLLFFGLGIRGSRGNNKRKKKGWGLTSPPALSSRIPSPGMLIVKVAGSFWASVRMASIS